jgi:hypothetical protein
MDCRVKPGNDGKVGPAFARTTEERGIDERRFELDN